MDELEPKPEQPKKPAPKKRKRPSRAKSVAPKRQPLVELDELTPQQLQALQEKLFKKNLEMFREKASVSVYDPSVTEAKQAIFEEQTAGAFVISDEWQGQLETGNPFDDVARPYQEQNPDKHFRYLSTRDSVAKKRGRRGYTEIKGPDGKTVDCAGMPLCWIPKQVHEERQRKRLADTMDALDRGENSFREVEEAAKSELGKDFSGVKQEDGAYYGSIRQ